MDKLAELKIILEEIGEVIIAFSGGIDSTFLTKVAFDILKDKAVAITINMPQLPRDELEEAQKIAKEIGIKHLIIYATDMDYSWFDSNPPNRCYICKKGGIELIREFCANNGLSGQIIEGSNYDDLDDYRPGFKAVKELAVRSPLMEAKLTKEEIREYLKEMEIDCWDKPSSPCLATRFFFGEKITAEKLTMVDKAEKYLRGLGIRDLRVRVHGKLARIETFKQYYNLLTNNSENISEELKEIGFEYVTLDLRGYKRGAMNKEEN